MERICSFSMEANSKWTEFALLGAKLFSLKVDPIKKGFVCQVNKLEVKEVAPLCKKNWWKKHGSVPIHLNYPKVLKFWALKTITFPFQTNGKLMVF